jgi:hypothetical protein
MSGLCGRRYDRPRGRAPLRAETSCLESLAVSPVPYPGKRVSFENETSFAHIIEEHLELKRRNSQLHPSVSVDRYREDPFESHPLFGTEERARLEDALSGTESERDVKPSKVLAWPHEESEPQAPDPEDTLWGRCRDFDWGD